MSQSSPNSLLLGDENSFSSDMFDSSNSSPPVPPRPTPPRDLFGSTPFVVGGGQNEHGDAVFLVASDNSVDMVKLEPPIYSPRRKVIIIKLFSSFTFHLMMCGSSVFHNNFGVVMLKYTRESLMP